MKTMLNLAQCWKFFLLLFLGIPSLLGPIGQFLWMTPAEEGDDALESPEQKDVLTSGSASPSSTQSLEGAPATTSSTMLRDPESHHSTTPTSPQPPPHLIDSHDDVEHNIPATLIQDPSVER